MSDGGKVLPWAEESVKGWAESLKSTEGEGGVVAFAGDCPRCGHTTQMTIGPAIANPGSTGGVGGNPVARILGYGKDPERPNSFIAICHCKSSHPGTPAGKDGCGAFGGIELAINP